MPLLLKELNQYVLKIHFTLNDILSLSCISKKGCLKAPYKQIYNIQRAQIPAITIYCLSQDFKIPFGTALDQTWKMTNLKFNDAFDDILFVFNRYIHRLRYFSKLKGMRYDFF